MKIKLSAHSRSFHARWLGGASAFALGAALYAASAGTACAQETPAPSADAPIGRSKTAVSVSEIEVTGTRVVRDGYDAPTPTTVVGATELETRAPLTLIDALTQLPAFRATSTTGTANQGVAGSSGQSFANLRGLSPNRTLVLIDGERVVPSSSVGTVDIGTLPSLLVKRVDVVTGGASASWGSDAVAGVVNFVLDRDFVGFKGKLQAGETQRGDGQNVNMSLAFGDRLLDDKLNFVVAGEYYNNDGVKPLSRDFARNVGDVALTANPLFAVGNGQPSRLYVPYVYFNAPFQGAVLGGALKGTTFNPDGSVGAHTYAPCAANTVVTTPIEYCGGPRSDGRPFTTEWTYLDTPQERENLFAHVGYEITPSVRVWADLSYGRSDTSYTSVQPTTVLTGALTIRNDSAYLPASLASALAASGQTSFSLSKTFSDLGTPLIDRLNETRRFVVGFNLDLPAAWKASGYYEYGENFDDLGIHNSLNVVNFRQAYDAVKTPDGSIVCRSTLTVPGNGCVPINPFSSNGRSTAALSYLLGVSEAKLDTTQQVAAVNLTGNVFTLPAGPVSLAFGGEYRRETADQSVDPVSLANGYISGNPKPISGAFDVREVYAETVVPILRDLPFAHLVDFSAAARLTDYSTSGSVTTWKVGLNYEPIEDLRFRATRSRDIRAPNIQELFGAAIANTQSVIDPKSNTLVSFPAITSGNPSLQPEIADTAELGVVYRPSWFPGASLSVDHYAILINDAIGTLTNQNIVNRCQTGNQALCALVTRNAAGTITGVRNVTINLSSIKTTGFDIEASYRTSLSVINARLPGDLTLRALANYVSKFETSDGVTAIDEAGAIAPGLSHWTGQYTATYQVGPVSTFLNLVYIGGGSYDNQYVSGVDINPVHIRATSYLNAGVEYHSQVNSRPFVYFFNIDNLLDREPPSQFPLINGENYDRIGRRFSTGVRFQY